MDVNHVSDDESQC